MLATIAVSQPNTEVYLFDLDLSNEGAPLSNPVNISENPGYDNQPSFWPDGKSILYARTIEGQTEIARYFIKGGKTKIITDTKQGSEYSPTPTPDGNISSIRLDTTGLQLLYSYDLKGRARVLVPDLVIGYHVWIAPNQLVSFVLGEPNTMQWINVETNEKKTLAENIGRSLHKIPNSKHFSYVDKSGDTWLIKSMNMTTGESTTLIETISGAEDYCWTPGGVIIMGKDSKLYRGMGEGEWQEFFDLETYGLGGITRVAVSPDGNQLVLVVNQ
ncbi:MAG: hypothetical protein Tsb0034_19500 [Ekhidna sp.]